jgi:3-hydroxybutyryl-CoA dehydrogenase
VGNEELTIVSKTQNMQILVVGSVLNLDELKQKLGSNHTYHFSEPGGDINDLLNGVEVVFDFAPDKNLIGSRYSHFFNPVFFNNSLITLSELINQSGLQEDSFFGFCGLPTLVNRPVLEVSVTTKKSESPLKNICTLLATDFVCVEDRVGLVTPRVICMIINEAYYTLEEGTATRGDIDLAMKLGTNYPYGPFEWAKRISINHVIELLDAVYRDTHDNRYKVCDLLRSELKDKDA